MDIANLRADIGIVKHFGNGFNGGKDFAERLDALSRFNQGIHHFRKIFMKEVGQVTAFNGFRRIRAEEIIFRNIAGNVSAKKIFADNAVNNFGRRKAVNLPRQNMFKNFFSVVGVIRIFFVAIKNSLDNFGNEHAGFHVEVNKFLIGIGEDIGVELFQFVNHFDNDTARSKNLIGTLRRYEVKNIFIVIGREVVGKLTFQL